MIDTADKEFLIRLVSTYMALTEPIKFDHEKDIEIYETAFYNYLKPFLPETSFFPSKFSYELSMNEAHKQRNG